MFLLGSATVSVARWTCFVVDDTSQNLKLIFMIHNVCTQCNDLPHCECMTKTRLLYSNIVFSVVLLQFKAFFFFFKVIFLQWNVWCEFKLLCKLYELVGKKYWSKKKLYRHASRHRHACFANRSRVLTGHLELWVQQFCQSLNKQIN